MEFTIQAYKQMLENIKQQNYKIIGYADDDSKNEKYCILRHDIDMSVKNSVEMSKVEKQLDCKSTYFVLLSTNFYNVFDKHTKDLLKQIADNGCDIGLHFDECKYDNLLALDGSEYAETIAKYIKDECDILSKALDMEIKTVSMHRPSQKCLDNDIEIEGIINSYSQKYFKQYKYLSDSRRFWREDVFKYINDEKRNLHILTHPIWYQKGNPLSMKDTLINFCNEAKYDRYNNLKLNIKNLQNDLTEEDIK